MSKLPNAPLLEIIYELRWNILDKDDLGNFHYLHGDLFTELKNDYSYRESLVPLQIPIEVFKNQPIHRVRAKSKGFPLYQIGPGLLTLNTDDENYDWAVFYTWAKNLVDAFFKIQKSSEDREYTTALKFIDFFPVDINSIDVYEFINKKFNISFSQNFFNEYHRPNNLMLGYFYNINDLGNLSISFKHGQKQDTKENGIVLETNLVGDIVYSSRKEVIRWLHDAHEFSSNLFKDLVQDDFYKTFL